jgi:hypothetical protein
MTNIRVYLLGKQKEQRIRRRAGPYACLTKEGKALPGLTVRIKERVLPLKKNFLQKGITYGSSATRGRDIDNELTHRIDCARDECTCKKPPQTRLKAVQDILDTAKARGLKPVTTQLGVCYKKFIGTMCDVVFWDEALKKVRLGEVKSGTRSGPIDEPINPKVAKMIRRGPLASTPITYSYRNMHLLQLRLTRRMFQLTYPKVPLAESFVIYADRKDCDWTPESKLSLSDTKLDELLLYLSRKKYT